MLQQLKPLLPRISRRAERRGHRLAPLLVVSAIGVTVGAAQAAEISISGTYGTIAICIMDAFTDVPSGDVNFSSGGAPLARVDAGEFDTAAESCAFRKLISQSTAGATQSWTVEAACTGSAGDTKRVLKLVSDKVARTVSITDQIGTPLATVDQCSVPYRERLARELQRLSGTVVK